jgi:hypothetical protein
LGGKVVNKKHPGSIIECGCGATVAVNQMKPVDPSKLQELGLVELQHPGEGEASAKRLLEATLQRHQVKNSQILSDGLY